MIFGKINLVLNYANARCALANTTNATYEFEKKNALNHCLVEPLNQKIQ